MGRFIFQIRRGAAALFLSGGEGWPMGALVLVRGGGGVRKKLLDGGSDRMMGGHPHAPQLWETLLTKQFLYMTKKSKQKVKYFENEKSF